MAYKSIMHDGKEYRLEYSLEAYMTKYVDHDGVYRTHVAPLVNMTNEINNGGEGSASVVFDMPEVAVHAMYAGLLRWHGRGKRGDKTIVTLDDAAELCMGLIEANPDDEYLGSFAGLIHMCVEQLEEDHFFEKVGGKEPQDKKPKKK